MPKQEPSSQNSPSHEAAQPETLNQDTQETPAISEASAASEETAGQKKPQAYETKAWLDLYGPWTPHSLDYGDTTLLDIYDNNLSLNADKPATYFFGRTQTYSELDKQVRSAAAGLRALGVRAGDRVAIVLPNCPQHVAAYFAVLKLGAIVVEHNPLYTTHSNPPSTTMQPE